MTENDDLTPISQITQLEGEPDRAYALLCRFAAGQDRNMSRFAKSVGLKPSYLHNLSCRFNWKKRCYEFDASAYQNVARENAGNVSEQVEISSELLTSALGVAAKVIAQIDPMNVTGPESALLRTIINGSTSKAQQMAESQQQQAPVPEPEDREERRRELVIQAKLSPEPLFDLREQHVDA